jgi:hypothetical protein
MPFNVKPLNILVLVLISGSLIYDWYFQLVPPVSLAYVCMYVHASMGLSFSDYVFLLIHYCKTVNSTKVQIRFRKAILLTTA